MSIKRNGRTVNERSEKTWKNFKWKKNQSEKCTDCMISTITHFRKGKTIEIVKILEVSRD